MIEILENKYVSSMLTLIVVLYATFLRPDLPPNIKNFIKMLFDNTIFRIFVLFLVVAMGNSNPALALIIAIAFVLSMDQIYRWTAEEAFENITEGFESINAANGNKAQNKKYGPVFNIYMQEDGTTRVQKKNSMKKTKKGTKNGSKKGTKNGSKKGTKNGSKKGTKNGSMKGTKKSSTQSNQSTRSVETL